MVPDFSEIDGIGKYSIKVEENTKSGSKPRTLYYRGDRVFLVKNPHTLELRCDDRLSEHLRTKYESVMESRYFGRGGIEIVLASQLANNEIVDLIRLSYNLSK